MNYDKVIIGSSPVCLLEAIYSHSIGIKTCIIDNAGELGGAWKKLNTEKGEIKNVEIGCHIIEKDRKVYRFFKNKLGLELLEMQPAPKIIVKNKCVPYNLKNFIAIFRNARNYFGYAHGLKQFIFDLGLFGKELAQFNLKYYTFSKDSITFIDRLRTEVQKRNIPALCSANIISAGINTSEKIIELCTEKGGLIRTNKLAITYNTNFNSILIDGKDRTDMLQRKKYEFTHLHFFIQDKLMKKISYWRIFNNAVLHRVSDMSNQIIRSSNEHLICAGIYASSLEGKTNDSLTETILSELKKLKLVSESCRILKTELNSYKGMYTDLYDLKSIQKETNNLIEVLNTLDIARGIKENLHKYNKVQYSN